MSGGYFNKLNLSRSVELRKLGDDAARLAELSTTGLLARDFAVSATLFGVLSAASYYSIDALVSPSHQSTALAVSLASIGSLCLYNLVCGQSTTIPSQTAVTDTLLSVPAEDCAGKSGSAEDDDLPIEARPRRSAFFKDTLSGIDGAQTAKDVINAMKPSESNPDADCMLFRKPIASRLARPRKPASGSGGAASSSSGGGDSSKKLSIEKVVSHFENEASVWPRSKVLAALDVIGEQLRGAGLETGDRVNVFASTSHQWMLTAMACWNAGFTVVTSYASLGPDALAHTVHEARCSAIVCDRSLLPIVSQLSREHLRSVTHLFTIPDHASLCEELEVDSKEAEGELARKDVKVGPLRYDPGDSPAGYPKPITPAAISPSQPAMIMYTSGTTGKPKGVQLLHRTIAGIVHGFKEALPALDSSDVYHGYLPLAHIFEVAAELAMLGTGVPIAYGSPFTLTGTSPAIDKKPMARKGGAQAATEGDLLVYRPTFMAGVPRIFNKIRNGIEAKVAASPVAKVLFGAGLSVKLANIEKYGLAGCRHGFWDKLVFDGVRKKVTGGRLRVLIGGAGPTSPSAQRWLQAVFCCTMQQGYGLTETSAGGTVSMMYEYNTGTVGPPIGSARVWLRAHKDHPDKKPAGDPATGAPPTGEIWLSGSNVSPGYLAVGEQKEKMDRLNREVFQQRWGRTWFNTGDIGQWTPDGILRITGRTKALIKLSNGEYVNRGIVESELGACKTTAFLAVHVDPDHDYCVAVAVPDPAYFKASMGDERYAAALRDADCDAADCKPGDAMAALAKVEAVRREIKEEVQQVGRQSAKQARMGRAEVPGDVLVVGEDWLEKGVELVTDSQKNKHKVIYDRYAQELEAVYAGGK